MYCNIVLTIGSTFFLCLGCAYGAKASYFNSCSSITHLQGLERRTQIKIYNVYQIEVS